MLFEKTITQVYSTNYFLPLRRLCLFCDMPQICFFGWKFFEKYFKQIFGDTILTFASLSLFSPLVRPQPAVKQFITSFLSSFESKQIGSSGLENFDSGLIYWYQIKVCNGDLTMNRIIAKSCWTTFDRLNFGWISTLVGFIIFSL